MFKFRSNSTAASSLYVMQPKENHYSTFSSLNDKKRTKSNVLVCIGTGRTLVTGGFFTLPWRAELPEMDPILPFLEPSLTCESDNSSKTGGCTQHSG